MSISPSLSERYEDAKGKLLQIPGVVSVSLGYRETGKDVTDVFGLRVYVVKKKQRDEVLPEMLIPAEINGLMTDVIQAYEGKEISKGGTRPLVGGLELTQYYGDEHSATGTLGCIAKRNGSNQRVILSNQHVLEANGTKTKPNTNELHIARQPRQRESCCTYENIVGRILFGLKTNMEVNGKPFWVDAAIANINSDVSWTNMIGDIGVVNGSEDIMPFMTEGIPPNYTVRKKGMKTSLTTGVVIEVNHQLNIPGDGPGLIGTENIILIRPIAPFKELKVSYEVAPADKATIMAYFASNEPLVTVTANGNVLTFVTKTFGQAGDSGSVVVNSAGKVIGLFFAVSVYKFKAIVDGKTDLVSVDTGRGFACHISPVLQQMDITIESGAIHSAGEPIDLDEALLERVEMAPDLKDALSIAEADIRSLPEGEELINVFKSLGGEVTQLVHHHRPVKVVWHRNKCPAFSTSLINVVRDHTQMVHKEINGISISTAARNIGAALKEHGGTELRQALDQYGDIIIQLLISCNNYDDMLHFLKQRSWGVQWLTDN